MKFDVFLSHNGNDKPAVETLAHKLEEKGLKVWLDKWNLIPGNPWQEEIEEALDQCQTYAVFVGPSGMGPWENEEMRSALEDRVQDRDRRVIPVLLPGAPDNKSLKLPRFLRRTTWVDFRGGLNDEDALYRFECGIKGIAPKPLPKTGPAVPSADEAIPLPADLPLGSYIPFPPNPLFEGRVPQLRALADSLLNHTGVGTVINQTITGMGGIGKTQLAVEFAYRYGGYFRGVHWLNLADPSQLEAEIARCGREMRLPNFPEDQPTQVTLTLYAWKSDGPRLLILDNFEEPARANDVLRLVGHSSLRLLITSRRTDWLATSGLKPLPLEVFTPQESLDFLKQTLTKRKDADDDLNGLAERLGHLPLALELASRYLNGHPRLALDDYLTQSREALDHPSMHGWRADLPAPTEHDLDLQRTFALSWNALGGRVVAPQAPRIETTAQSGLDTSLRDYSTSEKIFLMAGYLAPNTPIPLEIFEKAFEISTETCDEALAALYGLGLLKAGETDLPAVHPLLADYARGLAKDNEQILKVLADSFEIVSGEALNTALPSHFALLRPHIPIFASYIEKIKLESASMLWNNYGYHLRNIADYANARTALERALQIDEATFGLSHTYVARDVKNLGLVMKDLGDLDGARTAFERALKIDEGVYGLDHRRISNHVNNIGGVLKEQGDFNGARIMYERALKIRQDKLGDAHQDTATTLNDLGNLSIAEGNLDAARGYLEKALQVYENVFGRDHPWVGTAVNNLGLVLKDLGDLAGARTALERALKIDEATYGTEHPEVATDVNNLGLVLQDLSDLAGAKAAFERVLGILEKTLPPEHPYVATTTNNLGMVLHAQGDLTGARAAFERALKIDEATYGPDHPSVARDVNNLGNVLQDLGDLAGAQAAYERALKIREKAFGEEHPDVAISLWWLGVVAQDEGNKEIARSYFERTLRIFKKFLPPDHPNIKNVQGYLDSLNNS